MEVRVVFKSELYISGNTLEEIREEWENMDIFSVNALCDNNAAVAGLIDVEDSVTGKHINLYEDKIQIWNNSYTKKDLNGFKIIIWPESQDIIEQCDFYDHAYLIDDPEGIDKYGSSAYVVESDWLDKVLY